MERYTYFDGGKWRLKIGDTEYSGEVVDRLAAYEETGLEPERIELLIPADDVAEVRHGRWIVSEMNFGYCDIIQKEYTAKKYTCSECGYETGDQAKKFACCPICMARMDEEDEHEAD